MSNFSKFPSIEQFRNVIHDIHHLDLPSDKKKITFHGTVKLHGTNAAVGFNYNKNIFWVQSRGGIITPEKDNYNFAKFAYHNEANLWPVFKEIHEKFGNISKTVIFGEWCGGKIQKGVALQKLKQMFVIFAILIDDERWLLPEELGKYELPQHYIYNIENFPKWDLEINFDHPALSQNKLIELTSEVEKCCPVAKQLGVEGTGEGIVWVTHFNNEVYRFKVKGRDHSVTKVKTLVNVDVEKVNSIEEFVNYAVTENRLKQGLDELTKGEEPSMKKIGEFIRWMCNDIEKEELDTMEKNGLKLSDVNKRIAQRSKEWYVQNF